MEVRIIDAKIFIDACLQDDDGGDGKVQPGLPGVLQGYVRLVHGVLKEYVRLKHVFLHGYVRPLQDVLKEYVRLVQVLQVYVRLIKRYV